jgi:hypothetical protein
MVCMRATSQPCACCLLADLYISILDLALDDTQTAVVTALFGLGAMLTLFKQYEVTRKEKIDMCA